ncbi:MAG: DNA-directed RNA polymerase subunit P [Candidatus Micrarchaeia archaeon]
MVHVCWKCRERIERLDSDYVHCPHCGCRVLFKERQPIAKDVKTD